MKNFKELLLILVVMINISSCDEITNITEEIIKESDSYEYLITNYGAVGDGKTDCAPAFKAAIAALPEFGGTIVIPAGNFLINSPIEINRNYVTIKGINEGLRSNIEYNPRTNPGGGSKLSLGNSNIGIKIMKGSEGRISGVKVTNLLISGGEPDSPKGTGVHIVDDNDGLRIENLVCINLNIGIRADASDALIINKCWVSECRNSIYMNHGIQNVISNCQLGAQPGGVTVNLINQENLIFSSNHVYPDGDVNLKMSGCTKNNITGNNFQSYYVGMLEIEGDDNLVSGNVIWLRNFSNATKQLRGQSTDYGIVRLGGTNNHVTSSSLFCDWASITNPVTLRSVNGTANRFSNLKITDQSSSSVIKVNETSEVLYCVPQEKLEVQGDINNIYFKY